MESILAPAGYELRFAIDGSSALAEIERLTPDLVLLDHSMPDMTGVDVLRELSASGRLEGLPVVMVTSADDVDLRRDALRAGAIDFLGKPFDRIELLCKVQALTELRRLRRKDEERVARAARAESRAAVEQAIGGLPLVLYSSDEGEIASGQTDLALVNSESSEDGPALVAGLEWTSRAHPDDRDALKRGLRRLKRGELDELTGRVRLRGPDGRWVWHQNVARRTPSGDAVCGALLDIGQQIGLEEQLLQAQKLEAIGALAGGIAHDFNNVLGAILSFGSLLRDSLPAPDPRRADAEEIVSVARRATGLTRQLLGFARSQATTPRSLDLNRIVRAQERMLRELLPSGVSLELRLCPEEQTAAVFADPAQLDQVVMNLVINARDAIDGTGRIEVAVERSVESVVLSVRDDGSGMSEEVQQKVFEPFFSTKTQERGTGLGLSTVFTIVRNAGGSIGVRSEVGLGTEFQIILPRFLDGVDETADTQSNLTLLADHCVLVVEDDPALSASVQRVLEGAGYRVESAATGPEAIEAIDRLGIQLDAVYSDIRLPGLNGFAVAAHAREVQPRVVTLLTSGYIDAEASSGAGGQPPILWKPVEPKTLLASLATMLIGQSSGGFRLDGPDGLGFTDSGSAERCETVALGVVADEPPPPLDASDLARVVVIDDDVAMQRALGRILRAQGYEVLACGTLAEARAVLLDSEVRFRSVLFDLSLPDGCASGLIREVSSRRPDVAHRVLVFSGGALTDSARALLEDPSVPRVLKPVDPAQLVEAIAALG